MERRVCVDRQGKSAEVLCLYKRIKNIHLRVYPDGRIVLSVPMRTEWKWIESYLRSKTEWIFRARERYEGAESPEEGSVCVLGVPRKLIVLRGRSGAALSEGALTVTLPSPGPDAAARRAEKFLREFSEQYFAERVRAWFPVVERRGAAFPEIGVRRMKSMWGNCNKHTGRIRFNVALISADGGCIDYVVLHELAHLLIPGHQADFHRFMSAEMPDWRERRRRLNRNYAKYL